VGGLKGFRCSRGWVFAVFPLLSGGGRCIHSRFLSVAPGVLPFCMHGMHITFASSEARHKPGSLSVCRSPVGVVRNFNSRGKNPRQPMTMPMPPTPRPSTCFFLDSCAISSCGGPSLAARALPHAAHTNDCRALGSAARCLFAARIAHCRVLSSRQRRRLRASSDCGSWG
jgi:hypothetical protein